MKNPRRAARVCLAGLACFSLVFSLLAQRDLWPRLPPGALHDADLVVGFAAGFLLIVLMARPTAPDSLTKGRTLSRAPGPEVDRPSVEAVIE